MSRRLLNNYARQPCRNISAGRKARMFKLVAATFG
jgi:hypothetical protein